MWVHSLQTMGTTETRFNAFYPHSDQEHLLVWGPAWKGHNRDLWSFCTNRNVLIYTLSVHGHSRRPAVWESCPVWWHRDRSGCLSPALSSKHMQLNLDWLRRTTDAARPPENWTHCPSSPFSTGCCVLFCSFFFTLELQLAMFESPDGPPTAAHTNTSLSPALPVVLRGQPTGADLRSVCTGLVLFALEEIKCSSYSTGWICVT